MRPTPNTSFDFTPRPRSLGSALGAALAVGASITSANAQSLDLSVTTASNTVSVTIDGATPSSAVALALDIVTCDGDLDGDRAATAADVALLEANRGPVLSPEDKLFDLDNDGFVNQRDVDALTALLGCSDPQSMPIPGCLGTASVNPATTTIFTVNTDSAGTGTFSIPLPPGFDDRLYFQAADVGSCGLSALVPYSAIESSVYVAPVSTISAIVNTDFFQRFPEGLVRISTDLDGQTVSKTSVGQSDAVVDITPGAVAVLTMGETPAVMSDDTGDAVAGVAIGMIDDLAMPEEEVSVARLHNTFQPFAVTKTIGAGEVTAPFHGLWDINVSTMGASYEPFGADIAVFPTAELSNDVLTYYGVPNDTLESARCAVFMRVHEDVRLDAGNQYSNGFLLTLRDFVGFDATPNVASRFLTDGSADAYQAPSIAVTDYDGDFVHIKVNGSLNRGDHLFLLADEPFSVPSASHITSPPTLIGADSALSGDCGTPPPPVNPPAVGGGQCQGGLGLWNLDDCVITGNYSYQIQCADIGPFLIATAGGAEGTTFDKKIETSYKGSSSVSVSFNGVGATVGQEVTHTEGVSTSYQIKKGNGCGQNLAWYMYEKICVTKYWIEYHTIEWEGWLPYPCWCCGCCKIVYSACKAGESIFMEVCDRDC